MEIAAQHLMLAWLAPQFLLGCHLCLDHAARPLFPWTHLALAHDVVILTQQQRASWVKHRLALWSLAVSTHIINTCVRRRHRTATEAHAGFALAAPLLRQFSQECSEDSW